MSKVLNFDNIEENENNSDSDSDIEIKPDTSRNKEKIYKQKKERAPYIYTDARKEAFEKAKQARELKRDERKLLKLQNEEILKKELDDKIIKKADSIKKKLGKKEKMLEIENNEIESETEIIIKKKPKKKIIIVESDSEDEIIIKSKKKDKQLALPIFQPPPIKKYVPIYY